MDSILTQVRYLSKPLSEGMDRTTLENAANYRLNKQGSKRTLPVGVKSVSADNGTVVLDPYPGKRNVLAKNTTYTITVLSGVKDNEQNPLDSNYSENLTTGSS